MLVMKGPSKDIGASSESSKVVVPGIPNKPVIVVKGAPITPIIAKPVTQLPVVDAKAVPWNYKQITVNHLEKISSKIFEVNRITFSDDELPMEGTEHNRAFYLTVKCEDFVISRVLVDNGSSANICPMPWIYAAKVVPSSLHKIVKFEWDRQEIVVHGDEDLSACNDTIVPFVKAEDDKGPWNGFVSGKGLGSSLQGIVHPVRPSGNPGTFGLGFTPTEKDVKRVKNLKQKEVEYDDEIEYDEEAAFEEISKELKQFEEKPKPNLSETEAINLGGQDKVKGTKISVHLELQVKEEIIKTLFEYKDVFAWSYDDMPGLSTDLQKLRNFKTDMSVKIKEEITKQLTTKVIRVTRYPIWLANVVPLPKKDGKTRVCVDYSDPNKAIPKDDFPLPNIHILIDNCAKHEIGFFANCYAGYHQILMDEEDAGKTTLIMPWGIYCYRVMPIGLKNVGVLGFMVSRCGIELDPPTIKAIQELPPPKNKIEVMSLLGRLNYISRFIAQLMTTCEPIFKLLKKNVAVQWTDECQEAFDKIKRYLSNPPVLVPSEPERPLILYLTILDNSFGCILGQYDITGKKEQAIYYLNKKFTPYEVIYLCKVKRRCDTKANGAVEAANKNIKKILHKMVQGSRQWHENLPFALLGYRTTARTSVGATPYLLIIAEAEIDNDDEWVKTRLDQLSLIDEKRLAAVCHGQLYQKRMARAYNKKMRPRKLEVGQLVLKHILPHQAEAKGKFVPNWQGLFVVTRVLPNSALYLTDIEGKCVDMAINSDAVKRDPPTKNAWFKGKKFCSKSSKKRSWLRTLLDNEI
ncbi:uncharacterized protein [Nicotiana sylvestris]|uniref:uncharacterized protein n=1 Tax=Nicotiana sylvestris TaxID=4096 RepID=UPI00388C6D10